MGHVVTIPAQAYLPTDDGAIPFGEAKSVAGTVFDFRTPRAVGDRVRDARDQQIVWGRGYDHNWVIGRRDADRASDGAGLRPGLGPRLRALVEPAGPAILFGQFPRRHVERQGGQRSIARATRS
jgi:hypothetical protein